MTFVWFYANDRSFIWNTDGWQQHYKALTYYGQYLREVLYHLLEKRKLIIPDWDFYIGEGSDIIATLHYYVIGDPIALFSVFVPTKYMHYFYSFSCLLRLYLAGISFSVLAFGTGQKNYHGIIAGAISYSFSTWALVNVARHPYFLNPMIYFPLMILGIEKVIRKERPYLFIGVAAVSAASNFYFFYMIALLAIVYALIRLGFIYGKNVREAFFSLLQMGIMAVIGVAIAGVLLFPMIMVFLGDSRISASKPIHLFYPLEYYSKLPSVLVSQANSWWLNLGFTAPVLAGLFVLFLKKDSKFLRTLTGVCVTIILFPVLGQILNGMSYMSNRWCWAFILLACYVLAYEWENLFHLSANEWCKLFSACTILFVCCLLFEKSRSTAACSAIVLLLLTIILLKEDVFTITLRKRQIAVLAMAVIGAAHLAFWKYSPAGNNYANEAMENRNILTEQEKQETKLVKEITNEKYPRYTGRNISSNFSMMDKISSTQYYWTLSNSYMNRFRSELEMAEQSYFNYTGYDDRTSLIALSAIQYYTTKEGNNKGLPYGYELLKKDGGYEIYKNKYTLPLGYCYDSYIPKEQWSNLDVIEKQQIQLESVYLDEKLEDIPMAQTEPEKSEIPFHEETQGAKIVRDENSFITTDKNTKVVLEFEGQKNAETYVAFSGLDFAGTPEYDLYFSDETVDPGNLYSEADWDKLSKNNQSSIKKEKRFYNLSSNITMTLEASNKVKKTLNYRTADDSFSSGRHDFVVNLGYSEEPLTSVTITFPARGVYTLEDLKVYCVPMDDYAEKIEKLNENPLQDIVMRTDQIAGNIKADEDKVLVMAVPYSDGWKAYVDGKPTETMLANCRYIGVHVPKGEHTITFRYSMPYKKAGFFVSCIGFAAFAVVVYICEKKREELN